MERQACCILTDDDGERLLKWLTQTPGRNLMIQEQRCVEELLASLFGCYLLQVGWGRAFTNPVAKSQIRRRIILEECFALMGGTGKVLGRADALPIASDSMDAVFLPHTLEFAAHPRQVLLEADRVLMPGGYLVLLGFNPFSLWGIWRNMAHQRKAVPWCGKFIGLRQVEGWLTSQGFQIEQRRSIMFLPPLRQASVLRQLQRIEPFFEHCLPLDGAVYGIRAIKRVSIPTPLELNIVCSSNSLMAPAFKTRIGDCLN